MYQRLNKIGVCLSHPRTVHYVSAIGCDFDRALTEWLADDKAVKFVGDNLNLTVIPHAASGQVKDYNWFAWAATPLRVSGKDLDNASPIAPLDQVPLSTWLLSPEEATVVRQNFITALSRVVVSHFSSFSRLKSAVPQHVAHPLSEEMSLQSTSVLLEVLPKDENKKRDMLEILESKWAVHRLVRC